MTRILLALLVACPLLAAAQFSFTNASPTLLPDDVRSPLAIGMADMNGDALTDIVRINQGQFLRIDYQDPAGGTFTSQILGFVGSEWSLCIGDLDNNGLNDIASGGFYNTVKLHYNVPADNNSHSFVPATLTNPSIFLQGSNFADIDNDGFLDYFACHDHGLSPAFRNLGNGSLVHDPNLINPVSTIPSDNSGNYGSTWTDYDNDGDLDLYISKCRGGINNPLDGRRVNLLFRNDGDGQYTEVAEAASIRPLGQSWAADFADFDNDGDLDAVVVNHDISSLYYRNNGDGTFSEQTALAGLTGHLSGLNQAVEVMSADFDNDGYLDLLITSLYSPVLLAHNLGNGTFELPGQIAEFEMGGENMTSAALGDLNNDGAVDLIGVYSSGYVSPGSQSDRLFLNDETANHWLGVRLRGHASNRNGIGARLELYGSWGKQIREIRAGESYGISHAHHGNFGIGTAQTVDSLVVRWPSGKVTKLVGPSIDQYLSVEEPQEVAPVIQQLTTTICAGSSLAFNGQQLSQSGTYYDTLTGPQGNLTIIELTLTVDPVKSSAENVAICSGSDYQFPDGSSVIEVSNPLTHLSILTAASGCDSLVTTALTPLPITETNESISTCSGNNYTFPDGTFTDNVQHPITHLSRLSAVNGCDSLVTTTITPMAVSEIAEQYFVCAGSPFIFPDGTVAQNITSPLTHLSTLIAASGCDSLVTTTLLLIEVVEITKEFSVCNGSDYIFPDGTSTQNIVVPLTHLSILIAASGCDSLVTTNLLVLPEITSVETVQLCLGDSYTFADGTTVNDATVNQYHLSILSAQNGCDSLLNTFLEIVDPVADFSQNGNLLTAYPSGNAATYQWSLCDNAETIPIEGATGPTFLVQQNGNYFVAVTQSGCTTVSDCRSVTIVAIAEEIDDSVIRFDPTTDNGWLKLTAPPTVSARISVFTADGRLLFQQKVRGGERILVNGPAGVYFYHLIDKRGVVKTGKLLVK